MGSMKGCQDLHYAEGRSYSSWGAYGQSKLANILFTKELADQLKGTQVSAVCLHPGVIKTNLARHMGEWVKGGVGGWLFENLVTDKTIPQGASTTLFGCLAPDLPAGAYLSHCAVAAPTAEGEDAKGEGRKKLWAATVAQWAAAEAAKS